MNLHRIFTVAATLVLLAGCAAKNTDETGLDITQKWDKIFPLNDMLDHRKVTFKTGFGNTLVGDLYQPMGIKEKLPAIAVCGPFGACKEQASGLYAQTLADMGFVTLAFDPSYTGESSGEPRYTSSPDINTDDFLSAVDSEPEGGRPGENRYPGYLRLGRNCPERRGCRHPYQGYDGSDNVRYDQGKLQRVFRQGRQ